MKTKFDRRDLTRNNGVFTFNNQVYDNIFWTLGSAMTVATVYQWIIWWAMANGFVATVTFAENPSGVSSGWPLSPCGQGCIFTGCTGCLIIQSSINMSMLCITGTSMSGRGRGFRTIGMKTSSTSRPISSI